MSWGWESRWRWAQMLVKTGTTFALVFGRFCPRVYLGPKQVFVEPLVPQELARLGGRHEALEFVEPIEDDDQVRLNRAIG